MKHANLIGCAVAVLVVTGLVSLVSADMTAEEKKAEREDVQKMAKETLSRLYAAEPGAKKSVTNAAGYAVFSSFGTKIFIAGGGKGSGLAVNNRTKKVTYMKMLEVQAGLGFGIKKFRLVWVFEKQKDLDHFVNSGLELGAQTTVGAQLDDKGAAFAGAMSISPGVWLYQLTDDGLALELTAKGTKYYKNKELN